MLHRFLDEDVGQDIVEYALLLSIFGTGFLTILPLILPRMTTAIERFSSHTYDLWIPDPA